MLVTLLLVLGLVTLLIMVDEKMEHWHLKKQHSQLVIWDATRIARGRAWARQNRLNVCFIARDCEASLRANIPVLEAWGALFGAYRVVAFENDSRDGTRDAIKEWAASNPRVKLLSCSEEKHCKLAHATGYSSGQFSKNRIQKMGEYRERYLDELRNHAHDPYELTMVVDIDLDLGTVPHQGLLSALAIPYRWDAIFHNGRSNVPGTFGMLTVPYDAMAYESDNKTHSQIPTLLQMMQNYINLLSVYSRHLTFTRVGSGFNGIALYKTDSLLRSSYLNDGTPLCEHVVLHAPMKDKYASSEWVGYHARQGDGSVFKQIWNTLKGR